MLPKPINFISSPFPHQQLLLLSPDSLAPLVPPNADLHRAKLLLLLVIVVISGRLLQVVASPGEAEHAAG